MSLLHQCCSKPASLSPTRHRQRTTSFSRDYRRYQLPEHCEATTALETLDSVFATANARTVGAGVVDSTVRAPVLQTSDAHAVTAPSSTANAASVTACDAVPEQVTAYQRMPFADPTAIRRGSAVMGYYVDEEPASDWLVCSHCCGRI